MPPTSPPRWRRSENFPTPSERPSSVRGASPRARQQRGTSVAAAAPPQQAARPKFQRHVDREQRPRGHVSERVASASPSEEEQSKADSPQRASRAVPPRRYCPSPTPANFGVQNDPVRSTRHGRQRPRLPTQAVAPQKPHDDKRNANALGRLRLKDPTSGESCEAKREEGACQGRVGKGFFVSRACRAAGTKGFSRARRAPAGGNVSLLASKALAGREGRRVFLDQNNVRAADAMVCSSRARARGRDASFRRVGRGQVAETQGLSRARLAREAGARGFSRLGCRMHVGRKRAWRGCRVFLASGAGSERWDASQGGGFA
jgi:hypothetical protein